MRPALEQELKDRVKHAMGNALKPDAVRFVHELPKTRNGKVMRRVIRAMYAGQDPGDLSALENAGALDQLRIGLSGCMDGHLVSQLDLGILSKILRHAIGRDLGVSRRCRPFRAVRYDGRAGSPAAQRSASEELGLPWVRGEVSSIPNGPAFERCALFGGVRLEMTPGRIDPIRFRTVSGSTTCASASSRRPTSIRSAQPPPPCCRATLARAAVSRVRSLLGRPPILSYDGYALYNWKRFDPRGPIALGNIDTLQNFVPSVRRALVHPRARRDRGDRGALVGGDWRLTAAARTRSRTCINAALATIAHDVQDDGRVLRRIPEQMDPALYFTGRSARTFASSRMCLRRRCDSRR